jgi:RNA polymerase primary sigma factor
MFDTPFEEEIRSESAVDDSLRSYLNEIGRYPLLTRAEEVQLAKRIEAGDPAARQRLIECNLRLVVTIAKSYRSSAVDFLDLIQEGTLGLMQAADRYDWRRETKFSTYAAWWIRHGIVQAYATGSQPIRIPDSVRTRAAAIRKAERSLAAELGRTPSVAEIADKLELTVEQVHEARAAAQPVGSLHEVGGGEGERQYEEVLADPNTPDPLQALIDETPAIDLEETLSRLPERSRTVIELRFGLRDGVARTADSVADELGVARERVRQIELKTLRRLAAESDSIARAA